MHVCQWNLRCQKLTKEQVIGMYFTILFRPTWFLTFNGTNPHSVILLNNCSIHHCDEVVASLRDVGTLVHFLPPYSPDYNPIEEAFSKVKMQLKHLSAESLEVEEAVLASFAMITPQDCKGWVSHCGIYNNKWLLSVTSIIQYNMFCL